MFRAEYMDLAPVKKTRYSAGYDIRAKHEVLIAPGEVVAVPTGVWLDFDSDDLQAAKEDYFILLTARSSLHKRGLMLANGVGIIDLDYPGEIGVLLYNFGDSDTVIHRHERIAQLIISQHIGAVQISGALVESDQMRTGGFGHTGEQ